MGRKLIWGRLINYIHEFSLNSWESDGQELGWGGTLFIPDLGLVPLLFSKVSPSYAESPQSSKPLFFMHALPTCLQWQGAHNFIIQSPGKSVTIKAAFHPQLPSIFFFFEQTLGALLETLLYRPASYLPCMSGGKGCFKWSSLVFPVLPLPWPQLLA